VNTEYTNAIKSIRQHSYDAIVIGVSSGGFTALNKLFTVLHKPLPIPIIIVQHRQAQSQGDLEAFYSKHFELNIRNISDKQPIKPHSIYIAPASYHLLIESDKTFALSVDELVLYSRPSIDVLFLSAAEVFKDKLIGIILTGANSDGAMGLQAIKQHGGLTIVENPKTAHIDTMPASAVKLVQPDYVIDYKEIIELICAIQ